MRREGTAVGTRRRDRRGRGEAPAAPVGARGSRRPAWAVARSRRRLRSGPEGQGGGIHAHPSSVRSATTKKSHERPVEGTESAREMDIGFME